MKKGILFTIFLSLIQSGCVTYVYYPPTTTRTVTPNPYTEYSHSCHLEEGESPIKLSEIIELKGEPEDVEIEDGTEYFYYDKSLKWAGILLWVTVIPIPLLAPSNLEYCRFEVVDGVVVEGVDTESDDVYAAACGWLLTTSGSGLNTSIGTFGCHSQKSKR